jgi:two-component sensor histidine kinase
VENHSRLKYFNKHLKFSYEGLCFTAPEAIIYNYRMKGFDEDWQVTEQRSVQYTNLLPGNYTFQVKARNKDGVWSQDPASFSFTITPPFWQTWWFRILSAIILIGIIIEVFNVWQEHKTARVLREKNEELIRAFTRLNQEIIERKLAEEQIKKSLQEKELLLKEVHHRVKNNLQIISSLLDLSISGIKDHQPVNILQEARSRIHTMALIHSQLYGSDSFERINMEKYALNMIDHLSQVYAEKRISVTPFISAAETYLSVTQAIPCAIILNELVSNSFKHAFQEGQKGTISVSIQASPDQNVDIIVTDDGVGIPEDFDSKSEETLGLKLVRNLVEMQLEGSVKFERDKGTKVSIRFKIR